MALADSLARLGGTALLVMRQRLELAALDVEEELLHCGRFIVGALVTALLGTLAVAALAALVVVAFWESARMTALAGVALVFIAATVAAARLWLRGWAARPMLLQATLEELRKDGERLGEAP